VGVKKVLTAGVIAAKTPFSLSLSLFLSHTLSARFLVVGVKMINYPKNLQSSENYALNHAENIGEQHLLVGQVVSSGPKECKVIPNFMAVNVGGERDGEERLGGRQCVSGYKGIKYFIARMSKVLKCIL